MLCPKCLHAIPDLDVMQYMPGASVRLNPQLVPDICAYLISLCQDWVRESQVDYRRQRGAMNRAARERRRTYDKYVRAVQLLVMRLGQNVSSRTYHTHRDPFDQYGIVETATRGMPAGNPEQGNLPGTK